MFKIEATNLRWLEGMNPEDDLCLHGDVVTIIGDERLEENSATVSAAALYLLRTLTQDHVSDRENPIIPCCGFSMYADEYMANVDIIGCPNGVDWSVIHIPDGVKITAESGTGKIIAIDNYRSIVYSFVDKIDDYYLQSPPKVLPDDKYDREGYIAFWNEWRRRRGMR